MEALLDGFVRKQPLLYESLGCDKQSSVEQITAEYRCRARLLHPDKFPNASEKEEFQALQKAYSVLGDPAQRRLYDMWLDSPLQLDFEEFCRNSGALKMSMHWVTPRSTPMIPAPECQPTAAASSWNDDRYDSETARRFRNYDI